MTQATPTITWANPASIVYGTPLSSTQLDASASVPGSFAYSPPAGTILGVGSGQPLSVTFTPTDTTDYTTATATATITVTQATPTITWANPASIVFGTALSSTQLDATASVPGSFAYSPPAGTVLGIGSGQPLSATFTPTDTTDYTTATAKVTINVLSSSPPTLTAINVPGLTVVSQPVVVNGEMFFVGKDAAHGTQLWDTNGSASGTTQLTDGEDKVGGIYPSDLTALGGTLYFIASNSDGAGEQIWKSDGTVKGTALVTNRSTGGGTYGYLYPSDLAAFNGKLYFAGMHPSDGYQLFTTDGTSAGTAMVKDIAGPPGGYGLPGSYPTDLTAAGGLLYFSATDTSHGTQLWATDGTAAGTALMTTGNAARGGTAPQFLTADGGTLYFTGFSPSTGTQRNGFQLWASDGTQATTEQLTTGGARFIGLNPQDLTVAGSTVYFSGTDGSHGTQLWSFTGTTPGPATMLTSLNVAGGGVGPTDLTAVGSTLFFAGNNGADGDRLWSSNGTVGGTSMLADINGATTSEPTNLIDVGGTLYFAAYTNKYGYQVWQSDGTAAGTVIDTTTLATGAFYVPSDFTFIGTTVFFTAPGATWWMWGD